MTTRTLSQNDNIIAEFPTGLKCVKMPTSKPHAVTLLCMNDIPGNQVNALIRCLQ